jgi:hypothetical protein
MRAFNVDLDYAKPLINCIDKMEAEYEVNKCLCTNDQHNDNSIVNIQCQESFSSTFREF